MIENPIQDLLLSRRVLLLAGGAADGCTQPGAGGAGAGGKTPLESSNEALVTRFCLDWMSRDVEKLVPFLTDMALPGSKSRIGREPAA